VFINIFFDATEESAQILIGIIISVGMIFLLGGIVFYFIAKFIKKQKEHEVELKLIKQEFEKQSLQSQIEIQEQTFNAISQEIHDNVGQMLSLAKVQMNIAEEQLKNSPSHLKDAKENITRALDDLRDIAKNLNTDRIEELDFVQILQTEVDRLNKIKKIECNFSVIGANRKMGNKHKLIAFRIIQESINNILKHANASKINITINFTKKELNATITDNGIGFNTSVKSNGLGLQNIIKRAILIGGNAIVKSEIDKGTSIAINIPYEQ